MQAKASDGTCVGKARIVKALSLPDGHGVVEDGDGCVTELNFFNKGLSGTTPPELGDLPKLEILKLQDNQLMGPIPAKLGDLSNLEVLELQDNQLTGAIPATHDDLAELEILGLSNNALSGAIPK